MLASLKRKRICSLILLQAVASATILFFSPWMSSDFLENLFRPNLRLKLRCDPQKRRSADP
jgi:hypothetical protein